MKTKNAQKQNGKSLRRQVSIVFTVVAGTVLPFITVLIVMLIHTSSQYTVLLKNANTAADFNTAFKENIDSAMYNHVIRPRTGDDISLLPMADLDDAVGVLTRLEQTTTLPDNKWRIRSMLNWCESLRGYMTEIAETERYDDRVELLERNISGETGLTRLIDTYMHDYLDAEVREMVRLQGVVRQRTSYFILFTVAVGVLLMLLGFWYSFRVSKAISGPISALSRKVSRFGQGDFASEPVHTDIIELNTLDHGFDEMAEHINTLMKTQIEDQRSLHKAELELLQAQINPHFLYNTLDSIAILAENERGEDAVRMVNSLSSFFRISLSKGKDIIPLEAEIHHVKSYLEIQQIRYSDILQYEIDVPEALYACRVPKLILQPLVENALYHGIKNRRGIGHIRITGEVKAGEYLLRVEDDGAGMDEEQMAALRAGLYEDRHTGLGIINVHKRIRLYCGDPYGLSFDHRPGSGTIVTIHLPMQFETGEQEA